jgi:hypothetical protein
MIERFTSTYGSCHDHDCMIVGFTCTYDSCHGYACMIVGFSSTYDSCHGIDCMQVGCTSRYGGFRVHDYNGSIIVIFNLFGFFWINVVIRFYLLSDYAF